MTRKARRIRAGQTKSALATLYRESGSTGASSRTIVDLFKSKHPTIIERDHDELIDYALMLLAGRVATAPISDPQLTTLFGEDLPKQVTEIRVEIDGKVTDRKLNTGWISPRLWQARLTPAEHRKSQRPTSDELVDAIIARMIAEGMPPDMSIDEYAKR